MLARPHLLGLAAMLRPKAAGDGARLGLARHKLAQLAEDDPLWALYGATILQLAGLDAIAAGLFHTIAARWPGHSALPEDLAAAAQLGFWVKDLPALGTLFSHATNIATQVTPDGPDQRPYGTVRWRLHDGAMRFRVAPGLLTHPYLNTVSKHLAFTLPLLAAYMKKRPKLRGELWLNLEDVGDQAGLAFCDHRPEFFLLPDPIFLGSKGYVAERDVIDAALPPWSKRHPKAFWRGSATGWLDCQGSPAQSWQSLPRILLCQQARQHPDTFDVGLSAVHPLTGQAAEAARAGALTADFVPMANFGQWRYQIDIDGNSNAWMGLFVRLYTGSPVLKIASPTGFRQWYYDRLIPWQNHVPVAADLHDLPEKVDWLRANDDKAKRIGAAGRALARSMTLSHEMQRAIASIDAAFAARQK